MKIQKRLTPIFAAAILIAALFCAFLPAYATESEPTVYLPNNRFADFRFQSAPANAVIVSISSLDDRLSYPTFDQYIVLKTQSGAAVAFDYTPLTDNAFLTFVLPGESVYLTLSDALNALPGAEFLPPVIASQIPLSVDAESIRTAASKIRSGTVSLRIESLAENDELLSRAAAGLKDVTIEAEYHFDLAFSRTPLGSDTETAIYFGGEGRTLKLKAQIPGYSKNYTYAILTEQPNGILIHEFDPANVDGFYTVDFEIARNGKFSIIAFRTENFPLWAILLTVGGGLCLLVGGALLGCFIRRRAKLTANRIITSDADPAENTADKNDPPFVPDSPVETEIPDPNGTERKPDLPDPNEPERKPKPSGSKPNASKSNPNGEKSNSNGSKPYRSSPVKNRKPPHSGSHPNRKRK